MLPQEETRSACDQMAKEKEHMQASCTFFQGKRSRDQPQGRNGGKFAVSLFCRFWWRILFCSWNLQHLGGADFHRKPQETAESCRNLFAPCSLSLLIPPYSGKYASGSFAKFWCVGTTAIFQKKLSESWS